jgi:hypothetical protein
MCCALYGKCLVIKGRLVSVRSSFSKSVIGFYAGFTGHVCQKRKFKKPLMLTKILHT